VRGGWLGPDDALPTWRRRAPRGAWATLGVGLGASLAAGVLGAVAGGAWDGCVDHGCAGAPGRRALAEDGATAAWTLGGVGLALTIGGASWAGASRPVPEGAP
jgi:hypothetical protein